MGKVTTSISIDSNLHELAKCKGLVISRVAEESLRAYLNLEDKDPKEIEDIKDEIRECEETINEATARRIKAIGLLRGKEHKLSEEDKKRSDQMKKEYRAIQQAGIIGDMVK